MNFFKDIRKSYIITSLIYIVIGLVMAFWPQQIGVGLCYVLGALACVYGVVRAVTYFTKPSDDIFRNDLAIGLIVLASGFYFGSTGFCAEHFAVFARCTHCDRQRY